VRWQVASRDHGLSAAGPPPPMHEADVSKCIRRPTRTDLAPANGRSQASRAGWTFVTRSPWAARPGWPADLGTPG